MQFIMHLLMELYLLGNRALDPQSMSLRDKKYTFHKWEMIVISLTTHFFAEKFYSLTVLYLYIMYSD